MCIQRFEHFLCGHDRLTELLCIQGTERGPFHPKFLCPGYNIQRVYQNFSCSNGGICCASSTDAGLFGTLLGHSNAVRAQILQIDAESQNLQSQLAELCAHRLRHGLTLDVIQRSPEYKRCAVRLARFSSARDVAEKGLGPVVQLLRSRADYEIHRCYHMRGGSGPAAYPAFLCPILVPPGLPAELEALRFSIQGPQRFPPPPPLSIDVPALSAVDSGVARDAMPVLAGPHKEGPTILTDAAVEDEPASQDEPADQDETSIQDEPATNDGPVVHHESAFRRSARATLRVNYAESDDFSMPNAPSDNYFEPSQSSEPESPLPEHRTGPHTPKPSPLRNTLTVGEQPDGPSMGRSGVDFAASTPSDLKKRVFHFTSPERKVKVKKAALVAEESLRAYQKEQAAPYRPGPAILTVSPELSQVFPHVNQSSTCPSSKQTDASPGVNRPRSLVHPSLHGAANASPKPQREPLKRRPTAANRPSARTSLIVRLRMPKRPPSAETVSRGTMNNRAIALYKPTPRVPSTFSSPLPASPSLLLFGDHGRERRGPPPLPANGSPGRKGSPGRLTKTKTYRGHQARQTSRSKAMNK